MKKQILIIVLVLFSFGITNSFGQGAKKTSSPKVLSCAPDAYHPIPGVPYDYSATVSPIGGKDYWFATTKTSFIAGSALMATTNMETVGAVGSAVGSGTNYMSATNTSTAIAKTTITWTAAGLAAATVLPAADPKLFVGVHYSGVACNDNLKVYPIRPVNAFTVDIKNMSDGTTPLAYDINFQSCFPGIVSALYTSGAGTGDGTVDYDFGTNIIYYEIVASNFSGRYIPTLRLGGLNAKQSAAIDWGYTAGTYDTSLLANMLNPNGDYPISGGIIADGTVTGAAISLGVSIFVRVTIKNLNFEGLGLEPVTLAVEAVNEAGQHDVDNITCTAPIASSQYEDIASQDLKARPSIDPVGPNPFLLIK